MVSVEAAPDPKLATTPAAPRRQGLRLPLENGERLGAAEFLRRYDDMPDVKKVELIQGVVYLRSSPVSLDHGDADSAVQGWLYHYAAGTPGVRSSTNSTTRLSPRDVPQPDALLRILPECGGRSGIEQRQDLQYISGPPELVFEVATSSRSLDALAKKESYLQAGVREYILWRVLDGEIDWWRMDSDEFQPVEPGPDGVLRSSVFPGLWLDRDAMLRQDAAKVLAVLQDGLASEDHANFVSELSGKANDVPGSPPPATT